MLFSELTLHCMPVLQADRAATLASQLAQAWAGSATFACLPAKCPLSVEQVAAALAALPEAQRQAHFLLLTSGSTGEPKFIVASRERAQRLADTLHQVQRSAEVAQTLAVLPLSYSYAFVNQFVWAQRFGRQLRVCDGLADPAAMQILLAEAVDAMLCLVGAQVPLLLQHWGRQQFPGVIRLHFAGGQFPGERLAALARVFPNAQIFNNFGCAEAMPRLTVRAAADSAEPGCLGWPIPGVELRTLDDDSLVFRSAYQAVGMVSGGEYHPIADASWTATGDLARHNPDLGWHLLGRRSEVFKRYGEKVSLPALLSKLRQHWSGEAAFFMVEPHQGELAHALALTPAPDQTTLAALLQVFRSSFGRAHWPVRIFGLPQLPLLANGKPDLVALAASPDLTTLWRQRL